MTTTLIAPCGLDCAQVTRQTQYAIAAYHP
jgi:hypothetical protein